MLQPYPTVRVIVLITDGCSNFGGDPVAAAAEAESLGYSVSTIGVIDDNRPGPPGIEEVRKIAAAGGGVCDLVEIKNLTLSMQKVVRQTVRDNLGRVVHRSLCTLLDSCGEHAVASEEPDKYAALVERLYEEVYMQCVIAIDVSRSMRDKLEWAKRGVSELMAYLQSRRGKSETAVICFPSPGGELTRLIAGFSADPTAVGQALQQLVPGGGTPTGPAIHAAIRLFRRHRQAAGAADGAAAAGCVRG